MPSDFFRFINGHLSVEDLPLAPLAERFGTPLYIYSRAALTHAYCAYARACAGRNARIYYAVKRTAPWPCWMFSRVWARALISYRAESSRACWRRADAPV